MKNADATANPPAVGLILAGGRSTRMGGRDKAQVTLGGQTLLTHAVTRLAPQVAALAISSNAPPEHFAAWGLPVLPDLIAGFAGPLAGIHAGLVRYPHAELLAVAVDLPLLPADLVSRLRDGVDPQRCAYASDGTRHALALLFPPGMAPVVQDYLERGGRNLRDFLAAHGTAVPFTRPGDRGLFMNLNTPEELAAAEQELSGQ